uniref:FAD-dependent oxidoreductase domain-containing protein 1 n=1 Tax=Clastoptera arizonana TaxID=38151 RepID=A0A1B6E6W7_9HEMI
MPQVVVEGCDEPTFDSLHKVIVKLENGETKKITFAICVIAAGAQSGHIASLANIGSGPGPLKVPLPVEPRKRYVFNIHCNNGPGLNTPLTVDPTGTYFRREGLGGNYICGVCPPPEEEPDINNLDVDHKFFEEKIWPVIAHRVPAFEAIKVKSAWAGYYDYNFFDRNGIIGPHPGYLNLYLATGFSGHGLQQAPAVGRAIMELIVDGSFRTIDLSKLGYQRILNREPAYELNIV